MQLKSPFSMFPKVPTSEPGLKPQSPKKEPPPNPPPISPAPQRPLNNENERAVYHNALLRLIRQKMEAYPLSQKELLSVETPWPGLKMVEEKYKGIVASSQAFGELQQSMGIGDDKPSPHSFVGRRVNFLTAEFMISVVDQVISLRSGYPGRLGSNRAKVPFGLMEKLIEYDKVICSSKSQSCTEVLERLYLLFSRNPNQPESNIPLGYFIKYVSGQIEHSLKQRRLEKEEQQRLQEEEQRRLQEEEKQRLQKEELERLKKTKCFEAIQKGYYGTLQGLVEEDIGPDEKMLTEILDFAEKYKTSEADWILSILRGKLAIAKQQKYA